MGFTFVCYLPIFIVSVVNKANSRFGVKLNDTETLT